MVGTRRRGRQGERVRRIGRRPAGAAPFQPRASRAPDGRLWFANETVVQMIDPAHQAGNAIPPPVHIEQIIADRKSYPATPVVHLPPLTGDLEIDYVGLSFVAPQKVRFRYRLEGRDHAWQEPGTRRQAFYTDLRPGTYRFRVMASNNDGLWNEHGAALDIVIRSRLVSDERVSGAVRHQCGPGHVGALSACACVRWRGLSTPASTSGWRNARAWRATSMTRCCRRCRAARWSSTTRCIGRTMRRCGRRWNRCPSGWDRRARKDARR